MSKASNPVCPKCNQRMRWFSDEIVISLLKASKEHHVDVFQCEGCGRFTARAAAEKPRTDRAA